jgi:hypothetical protein
LPWLDRDLPGIRPQLRKRGIRSTRGSRRADHSPLASPKRLPRPIILTVPLQELTLDGVPALVAHLLSDPTAGVRWFRGQRCAQRHITSSLRRALPAGSPSELLARERRLITRFRQRSLPYWPEGYPQTDWEHLFAMQHFGVPTRLIDWTESLLIAVFFAARDEHVPCESGCAQCTPAVWILDPVAFNRHNSRLDGMQIGILATSDEALGPWAPDVDEQYFAPWPVALYGTHNSRRIVAQQGTFTVDGKERVPLDEVPAIREHEGVLEKIVIRDTREHLRRDLQLLGITQASAYPGLEGLAKDVSEAELR